MVQARKKQKKASRPGVIPTLNAHGMGMLLAGMVIGSLGTVLWQGWRSNDAEVGAGIRQMIESSRRQDQADSVTNPSPQVKPEPQTTNYDFFTVLPEIEVVVSDDEPAPAAEKKVKTASVDENSQAAQQNSATENQPAKPRSAYMLQAGSFNQRRDADRQKAGLALLGLSSTIQKVSIQGRGDFYRVRLGPFTDHAQMAQMDERLREEGIKALRLKISKGG